MNELLKLAEAYYAVGNHMKQEAERISACAEMILRAADGFAEEAAKQKQAMPGEES